MREHKYRAWHKTEYKMVYFSLGELLGNYCDEFNYCSIANTDLYRWHDSNSLQIMEYTGLPDKHGREMCQGDIVIRGGNPKFKYEVVWSDQHARFLLRSLFHRKGGVHGFIALSRNIQRSQVPHA